jgi:hypothetical protein
MEGDWYYATVGDKTTQGPMSAHALAEVLRTTPNATALLVWRPGMANWAKVGDVQALRNFLAPHRPPPPRAQAPTSAVPQPREAGDVSPSTHHWRRYFARSFDNSAFGLLFIFFFALAMPDLFDRGGPNQATQLLLSLGPFWFTSRSRPVA